MEQKKNRLCYSALCIALIVSNPTLAHAQDDVASYQEKRITLLENAIQELAKQAELTQNFVRIVRESLTNVQKGLKNLHHHQLMQELVSKTKQDNLHETRYNQLLMRVQNWRAYYQASSQEFVQKELDTLQQQGILSILTSEPMHPDLRLDLAFQFTGLMLTNRPEVARAREMGIFDSVFMELGKEYRLRKTMTDAEYHYMFDNLAEQFRVYFKQMDVSLSLADSLVR